MPRRIEVELTSARPDGSWTWRAAGARQPKGELDGSLLFAGARVGDVVRADADIALDGITILTVLAPRQARQEPERLEIIGPPSRDERPVTTTLVRGPGGDRSRDRPARARQGPGGARGARRDRRPGEGEAADRPRHEGEDRRSPGRERAERPRREGGDRRQGGDRGDGRRASGRDGGEGEVAPAPARVRRPAPRPAAPTVPTRPKPKRLRPRRAHRAAVIEALPPEQRPIAEQVLQGGVRAVVAAVDKQNEAARAANRPEVRPDALVQLAEQMLPRLRSAEWRDRAEAAIADVDVLDLRDLRSVVVAAETGARDDEGRELAATLRASLARRVDEEQATWLEDLTASLADGRVVRALRLSSRPPKAGVLLSPELAGRLAGAASAALAGDVSADRWATVLDAVAFSPVRRAVRPASVPDPPSEDLRALVQRFAGRLPDVASAFGIEAPPPPPDQRGNRSVRSPRRGPGRPTPRRTPVASAPPDAPVSPAPAPASTASPPPLPAPAGIEPVPAGSTAEAEPASAPPALS